MNASLPSRPATAARQRSVATRPRLGFIGVGWIGLNRLEAIAKSGVAEVAAIADPSPDMTARAAASAPDAQLFDSLETFFLAELDGVVIATPSALHAEQVMAALDRGMAVFCQKPVGRSGPETRAVVEAARRADRRLGVDLSYRRLNGAQRLRELIQSGELGDIYAVEMAFHNAYGPDKAWFYNRTLSGGGCVMDLGIHLLDLALWTLDFPAVSHVTSRLYAQGRPWRAGTDAVEDYATARIDLATNVTVQLACSWKLPAGRDAVIQAAFYGTKGGAALQNVNGSFYDFVAERYVGTRREVLSSGPEDWGGRAAVEWARALKTNADFDPEAERLVDVAAALDRVYAQATP